MSLDIRKNAMRAAAAICAAVCAVCQFPFMGAGAADAVYEAESAKLTGKTSVQSDSGFSGGKYVNFQSGTCTFTVTIPESGMYSFNFVASGIGGDKINNASLDGDPIGTFSSQKDSLSDGLITSVYASKGTHQVQVSSSWGWIKLDRLEVSKQGAVKDYYAVSKELSDPKADECAKRLMSFLVDNYGKNVLSGQQCDGGLNGTEFKAIKSRTGKLPAVVGLDLMDYSPARVAKGTKGVSVERAIEFSQAGGIVTLCWHWNAPNNKLKSGTDEDGHPRWWGGFYTKNVNMDFDAVMNGKDEAAYDALMADIDAIAVQLKKLQDAGVPVLFRPLHEGSGGWFWWGSGSAESYKKLWRTMYDRLTNKHGIHNLIWVYNGQAKDWYPGDEYVDIIGEDIYPGQKVYSPQSSRFDQAANYTSDTKIVTLSENGCLFDVDKAIQQNTLWSWFCVWGGSFATGYDYSEASVWKSVYAHDKVLTLDELPDLDTYPLELRQGDIDGDGDVDVNDLGLLIAHVKSSRLLKGEQLSRGDIDGDGNTDAADLGRMIRYIKGAGSL